MEKLDEKDRKICMALEKNARASVSEIARKTGIPRDSVHYRIQRLIKQKYVHTFEMILDHKKLGYPIYAYVNIELHNLTEENEKAFHSYLMGNIYIGHISKVTGRYDYFIAIVAKDMTHFDQLFTDMRRKFSEIIKDYTTATIIQEYKYDSFAELVGRN